MLAVGTLAPDFELEDQDGVLSRLSDWRGRTVVLFFYSKDMTSGCSKQAARYAELAAEFAAAGADIIGVSRDTAASHRRFADKYGLGYTLLADPERRALEAYEVWQEKLMYGKPVMGAVRTTYLIGPDGIILRATKVAKAAEDPARQLEALRALAK